MSGELTAEEAEAHNPPPPSNVRVAGAEPGALHLAWDPPPPVSQPHSYSDRVVGYRVYRRGPGEVEMRPIASVENQSYDDTSVRSGSSYSYAVSSIRERNVEGTKSDPPATATVP